MTLAMALEKPAPRERFLEFMADDEGIPRRTIISIARGLGVDVASPVWRLPDNVVSFWRTAA
jgi:hypothetical protein